MSIRKVIAIICQRISYDDNYAKIIKSFILKTSGK